MSTTSRVDAPSASRFIPAVVIGNFIEWFEFGLYGFFAASLAVNFFSDTSSATALLSTFLLFGLAFVSRPIGAILFGRYGDRVGRRAALSISIIGMSAATFLIGVIPGNQVIGVLAPVLLLIVRLAQGFFAGAEMGGAVTALAEYAPPARRGLYSGWNGFTQFVAQIGSALIGIILSATLTAAQLNSWGWRIPFLIALPLGAVGLYMRARLAETPTFSRAAERHETTKTPVGDVLRGHWRPLLIVCGLTIGTTTTTYMLVGFFPTYLITAVGLTTQQMFTAMLTGMVIAAGLVMLWSWLSDRYGRKPFLVGGALGVMVLAVPTYLLAGSGGFGTAMVACVIVAVLISPLLGLLGITSAELFPTAVRYTGVSIGISVIISLMGGSTPLILQALGQATGSRFVPPIYIAVAGALALVASLALKGGTDRDAVSAQGEPVSLRQGPSAIEDALHLDR